MKKFLMPSCIALLLCIASASFADITVGILPAKGDHEKLVEVSQKLKKYLYDLEGISIVADDVMGKIMDIHKKSMALGSSYHDIAKLKLAEYLISITVAGNNLELILVDVNSGIEVYRDQLSINSSIDSQLKTACSKMKDKLILHQGSRSRTVPEEARVYFDLVKAFAESIGSGDEASYKYIAFFHLEKYKHPIKTNPDLVQSATFLLQVIRPKLIRAQLSFVYMKTQAPLVYITVVASKLGKKTKITFAVIELDDGSLGITSYKME